MCLWMLHFPASALSLRRHDHVTTMSLRCSLRTFRLIELINNISLATINHFFQALKSQHFSHASRFIISVSAQWLPLHLSRALLYLGPPPPHRLQLSPTRSVSTFRSPTWQACALFARHLRKLPNLISSKSSFLSSDTAFTNSTSSKS